MPKYKTKSSLHINICNFNDDDFSYHDKLTPISFLQEHNEVTTLISGFQK